MAKFMFFDFRCTNCGTIFEDFVKPDVHERPCSECSSSAKRCISTPAISLPGNDPDFPGAWDKWAKQNKQKVAQDRDHFQKHGVDPSHGGDVKR